MTNQTSPYSHLVASQSIIELDSFLLDSGETLLRVPVAYKTWGKLNKEANNGMVLCHALSGSAEYILLTYLALMNGGGRYLVKGSHLIQASFSYFVEMYLDLRNVIFDYLDMAVLRHVL
jgi:hypothetical protein